MENKYYCVETKCGHVGRKNYIQIAFPICAQSKKEASEIARQIPRVKHDHKDAIISCKEINESEYYELLRKNKEDPYLQCNSRREQNGIENLYCRLLEDPHYIARKTRSDQKRKSNLFKRKKFKEILAIDFNLNLLKEEMIYA